MGSPSMESLVLQFNGNSELVGKTTFTETIEDAKELFGLADAHLYIEIRGQLCHITARGYPALRSESQIVVSPCPLAREGRALAREPSISSLLVDMSVARPQLQHESTFAAPLARRISHPALFNLETVTNTTTESSIGSPTILYSPQQAYFAPSNRALGPFPSPPLTPELVPSPTSRFSVNKRRSVRFDDTPAEVLPTGMMQSAAPQSVQRRVSIVEVSVANPGLQHPPITSSPERQHHRKRSSSNLIGPDEVKRSNHNLQ